MWKQFAKFLTEESGEPVSVPDLKKSVQRFFEDKTARQVVESGGDPLFDSIFEAPDASERE